MRTAQLNDGASHNNKCRIHTQEASEDASDHRCLIRVMDVTEIVGFHGVSLHSASDSDSAKGNRTTADAQCAHRVHELDAVGRQGLLHLRI